MLLLDYALLDSATIMFVFWSSRLLPERVVSLRSGSGLESPRLAQAAEALGADHQVIEDFHSE